MTDKALERPGVNLAAAIAIYEQQAGTPARDAGWRAFSEAMYRLANRYPRHDVTPEEAAHVWLEALGRPVPDPSCGRGT
jgi:hypothetical protein